MGKFLLGLIIGLIVGVLAMAYNPDMPQEVRSGLDEATALVMRGTERVADTVGELAGETAEEAGEAAREAERATPAEPGDAVGQPDTEAPAPAE